MARFTHLRHKPPRSLARPRELVLACPPMRSNVNLSRIVRTAACCGVTRIVACGRPRIDPKIARDGVEHVAIESPRTLVPALRRLRDEDYRLVGLEQTSDSECLYDYRFARRTVLVIGHEREGLSDDVLAVLDAAVEIPVYGLPFSYNAATAAAMAMYEYCRQFPDG